MSPSNAALGLSGGHFSFNLHAERPWGRRVVLREVLQDDAQWRTPVYSAVKGVTLRRPAPDDCRRY